MDESLSLDEFARIAQALTGQYVWGAIVDEFGVFSLQFGEPWLRIREPVKPRHIVSERTERALRRRGAYVLGEYCLWISQAFWFLETAFGEVDHRSESGEALRLALKDLEGQLVSVVAAEDPVLQLAFDLGATLRIEVCTVLEHEAVLFRRDRTLGRNHVLGTLGAIVP